MWYSRVVGDLSLLPDFVSYYEKELDAAKKDCRIGGVVEKNITKHISTNTIYQYRRYYIRENKIFYS